MYYRWQTCHRRPWTRAKLQQGQDPCSKQRGGSPLKGTTQVQTPAETGAGSGADDIGPITGTPEGTANEQSGVVAVDGRRNDPTVDTGQRAAANTEEKAAATSDDGRREKDLTLEELGGLRRLEEALEGQKGLMRTAWDGAMVSVENTLVFTELETLMVVARDPIDRVIKTSVRFTKKAGRLKKPTLQTQLDGRRADRSSDSARGDQNFMENEIAIPQRIPHEETAGDGGPEGRVSATGQELTVPRVARMESSWPSLVDANGRFLPTSIETVRKLPPNLWYEQLLAI